MKTKTNLKLLTVIVLALLFVFFKFSISKSSAVQKPAKPFLTVSEAKIQAFTSYESITVQNLKGILTSSQLSGTSEYYLLEDEEPSGMDDVPLYCSFSQQSKSYMKALKPGTELTISGMLRRIGNSVEMTNCTIICINKGTLQTEQFNIKF